MLRFTCWEQRTNSRFENIGVRLDYTIIDPSISKHITDQTNPKLRCCNYPTIKQQNRKEEDGNYFNSEEAALHAATASGQFEGASFDGGGIVEPTKKALDSQFGPNHTGIIYTPPSYSDHVAISLWLDEEWDEKYCTTTLELNRKCVKTNKAQPHKAQKSISSFFGKTSGGIARTSSSSSRSSSIISNKSNELNSGSSNSSGGSSSNSTSSKSIKSNSNNKDIRSALKSTKNDGKQTNTAKRKSTECLKSSSQKKKGTLHSFFNSVLLKKDKVELNKE